MISCSIAATFDSPRYLADARGLYLLLRAVKVIEISGTISRARSAPQYGRTFEADGHKGDAYISEDSSGLIIYVPEEKNLQSFCFSSPLPLRLAEWLMRDSTTQIRDKIDVAMVTALTAVLAVDSDSVSYTLQHQGILSVDILGLFEEEGIQNDDTENVDYRLLLDKVLAATRKATFPSRGALAMGSLLSALPEGDAPDSDAPDGSSESNIANGFQWMNQLERDFKIAAAGELYVSSSICSC